MDFTQIFARKIAGFLLYVSLFVVGLTCLSAAQKYMQLQSAIPQSVPVQDLSRSFDGNEEEDRYFPIVTVQNEKGEPVERNVSTGFDEDEHPQKGETLDVLYVPATQEVMLDSLRGKWGSEFSRLCVLLLVIGVCAGMRRYYALSARLS